MDNDKNFAQKIKQNFNDNRDSWLFAIDAVVAIAGMIISIITFKKDIDGNNTFFCLTLIVCYSFVLLICVISCIYYFRSRKIDKENEETINNLKKVNKEKIDEIKKENEVLNELLEDILIDQKDNNDIFSENLRKIEKFVEDALNLIDYSRTDFEKAPSNQNILDEMSKKREQSIDRLYSEYNQYIQNTINALSRSIRRYLKKNNCDFSFCISLELFEATADNSKIERNRIYTSCIFENKSAEINKIRIFHSNFQSFSQNSDYKDCISKGYYLENNIVENRGNTLFQRGERQLLNSNCIADVPIVFDSEKKEYYGFLCCFLTNDKTNLNPIDNSIINLMKMSATYIGVIINKLNSACKDITERSLSQKTYDFLQVLNKERRLRL